MEIASISTERPLLVMQRFLYDESMLSRMVRGRNCDRDIWEARKFIGGMNEDETQKLVTSLLGFIASPRDTSHDQDLREGALVLLEQVDFGQLDPKWVNDVYEDILSGMGDSWDALGNIEALNRVHEIILPALFRVSSGTVDEDEVIRLVRGEELDIRESDGFKEVLKKIIGRIKLSNKSFSIRMGCEDSYISKVLFRGAPNNEFLYRTLLEKGFARRDEVLVLLGCEGAPWLRFYEELEGGFEGGRSDGELLDANKVLTRIRENLGFSINNFAKAMDFDSSYLSRILNGRRLTEQGGIVPSTEDFYKKLLRVPGVTGEDIFLLFNAPGGPLWPRFIKELKDGSTSSPHSGTI